MARNYKTATPEFVQDIMYQPPWKLMQEVLQTKQAGYDTALQSTELFKNMLNINHLGFEDEKSNEIKEYWDSKVTDVVNQLKQNPNDYSKTMPVIRDLARELDTDRKTGNIAKIEGRHAAWNKWMKDNEDIQKEDPTLYNQLANHWYSDLQNKTGENFKTEFKGTKGILKPDINSKDMRDALKEFKANATETSNGMYKINNKWLSEAEVQQAVSDLYMANPNAQGYIKQMNMLKDPRYYDEATGMSREVFQLVDNSGNPLSQEGALTLQENYSKLSKDEKAKTPFPFSRQLNSQHGLAGGIRGWGNILGFKEQSMDEDKFGLRSQDYKYDSALQGQQDAAAMQRAQFNAQAAFNRDRANWGDKVAFLKLESGVKNEAEKNKKLTDLQIKAAGGDEDAQTALQLLSLESLPLNVKGKTIDYTQNLQLMLQGDRTAGDREGKSRDFARKSLGGDADAKAFYRYYDGQKRAGKSNEEIVASYIKGAGLNGLTSDPLDQRIQSSGMYTARNTAESKRENQVKGYLNNYEDKKKEWFDKKYSNTSVEKEFTPLTESGQQLLTQLYSSNKASWKAVSLSGEPLEEDAFVTKIQRATDGSGQGVLGYQGLDNKGRQVMVFPSNNSYGTINAATALTLENLPDQSYVKNSLMNRDARMLTQQLNSAGSNQDGSKSVVFKTSKGENIPVRSTPQGIVIVNPETNQPIKNAKTGQTMYFDSELKVSEFIN